MGKITVAQTKKRKGIGEREIEHLLSDPQFGYKTKGRVVPFGDLPDVLKRRYIKHLPKFIKENLPPKFQGHPRRVEEGHGSLYISGGVGSRKTTYLYWHLVRLYIAANIAIDSPIYPGGYHPRKIADLFIFQDTVELFSDFRRAFDPGNPETESTVMDRYKNCDVLYLDDLGAESSSKTSGWGPEILYRIINHRYKYDKIIVVSSNYDLKSISSALGNSLKDPEVGRRIGRRIMDMCGEGDND